MTHDDQHTACNPATCPTAAAHRAPEGQPTSAITLADRNALLDQLVQVTRERDDARAAGGAYRRQAIRLSGLLEAIAAHLGADPADLAELPALVHGLTASNAALRHQLAQALGHDDDITPDTRIDLTDAGHAATRTNPFNPITVDHAIEECTDLPKLRHLARQYRAATISEHEQGAHLLDIDDCAACLNAQEHGEPSYACADYQRRQRVYKEAIRADSILGGAASVPRTARENDRPNAEDLARLFHEVYEDLAPLYGYKTREASAKPWSEVPEQNRLLMIHTAARVLAMIELGKLPPAEGAGPKAERPIDLNLGVPEWLKEVDQYRWRGDNQAPKHPTSSEARAVLDHAIATALPQSGGAVEHLLLDLRAALAEVDRKRATQVLGPRLALGDPESDRPDCECNSCNEDAAVKGLRDA